MNWKIAPYLVILCLTTQVFSQDNFKDDLDILRSGFVSQEKKPSDNQSIDFKNEFRLIFSASYHFYKSFISSQDANNCAFHPSCSTYTFETIKTNGILGIFDAFDRLTRCNGFSPEKYPKHSDSKQFHDPVKKIH